MRRAVGVHRHERREVRAGQHRDVVSVSSTIRSPPRLLRRPRPRSRARGAAPRSRRRRPVSGSAPDCAFGNAVTSRMVSLPAMQHHQPVEPHRDPAVRRHPVPERPQQVAELLLGLLAGVSPSTSKTRRWTSGRWIRMLPPPSSNPFSDEVVRARLRRLGREVVGERRRERVVHRDPLAPRPRTSRTAAARVTSRTATPPRGSGRAGRRGRRRSPSSATFVAVGLVGHDAGSGRPVGGAGGPSARPAISSGDRYFSTGERTPSASTRRSTRGRRRRGPSRTCTSSSSSLRESCAAAGRGERLDQRRRLAAPTRTPGTRSRRTPRRGRRAPSRTAGRACPSRTGPSSRRRSSAGTAWRPRRPGSRARSARTAARSPRTTSSSSTNDISTSSWVNSKLRSARGCSSRRHRTIW